MTAVRRSLFAIAVVQILSTALGFVVLLARPDWFAFMLDGTVFEGNAVVPALVLGFVVGGTQLLAAASHRAARLRARLPLLHAIAGTVMIGWIAVECLILDMFIWPHAVWGGLGVVQLLLVLVLLGVLRPGRGADGAAPAASRA